MDHSASLKKSTQEAESAPTVDLVCGMTVEPNSAAGSFVYDNETYYFCSTHCLHEFRENPERFTKTPAERNGCTTGRYSAPEASGLCAAVALAPETDDRSSGDEL